MVCTETEDETDDQRMEEELDDETVVKRQRTRQMMVAMMIVRIRGGSRDLYRGVPVEPKLNSQNIMESDCIEVVRL